MSVPPPMVLSPRALAIRPAFIVFAITLSLFPTSFSPAFAQIRKVAEPAQSTAKREVIIDDDDVLRIDTDLVLVDVAVTDAEGRAVRGLSASDFKLFEDGEERPVAFLHVEKRSGGKRPVAVVFAVDVSGSMT